MTSAEIRQKFIEYFAKHDHKKVHSSSLVPENDATLLFANAGMNQFKNTFIGLEQRDYKRAVSAQKCVRAGGKHNDLENVGFTARHHTFFEMLGNFSFADYFKKEAIHFAWDFITNELKIPKERLYVTVHTSDDEAAEIWQTQQGVPAERIFRFDEDNYWRMGDVGPCGPSSEIFYDFFPDGELPTAEKFAAEEDRFVEFWNLVFMQYNEDESGRTPLPKPSIDTGCGFERLVTILQGQTNNYNTELFAPYFSKMEELSQKKYIADPKSEDEKNLIAAMRVLADHSRATSFLIADGVIPSNEGRGYVLRRIIRRALRFGRKISQNTSLMPAICREVVEHMGEAYPELKAKQSLILATVEDEEERFLQTLDQGTRLLTEALNKLEGKTVPGDLVFKLYDTYGFPVDLTRLMASEMGYQVNEEEFEKHMQEARDRARASWKGAAISSDQAHLVEWTQGRPATLFDGYHSTQGTAKILALSNGQENVDSLNVGETGIALLDRTVFYAESGGQVGDSGTVQFNNGSATVTDCKKSEEIFLHFVKVESGILKTGDSIQLQVDRDLRNQTAANHSATHLLHSALREILGDHVTQAGSLVEPGRLRFDFTHSKPLTSDEIEKIENWVNREINRAHGSETVVTDPKTAIEKEGALALFGEKYGDEVRVVKMGPLSSELCGGTHVENTAMIRMFIIAGEAGVSAGIRRIEAMTSKQAFEFLSKHRNENIEARNMAGLQYSWTGFMQDQRSAAETLRQNKEELKGLYREVKQLKGNQFDIDSVVGNGQTIEVDSQPAKIVSAVTDIEDRKVLSEVADKIKDKIVNGIVVLAGKGEGNHPIIVNVSKDLSKKIKAGSLLKEIAKQLGGKGGGRPDFAQGAIVDLDKADATFAQLDQLCKELLTS